jgi:uncharacterized protein (DUF1697 family)
MPRAVAFLRAINIGGHIVRMEELRRVFEDMGLSSVETFIASGNVVFDTRARNMRALEATISRTLRKALGYDVATFVRTTAELAEVAAHEPFDVESVKSAPTFCVAFVATPPDRAATSRIAALESDAHRFHIKGPHVYWLSTFRQNEPGFSKIALERTIGQPATVRGINTVRRMAARYAPMADRKPS